MQTLKPTRWDRFMNNVLSRKEAVLWAAVLIGMGIAIGLCL